MYYYSAPAHMPQDEKPKFDKTLGLDDIFPVGSMAGATVKEAIEHNATFVKHSHCIDFVLNGPAIIYMLKWYMK